MAKSITIRDVPDATRTELAARAARSGRSLQEYLRSQLIELAHRPDPDELIALVRDRIARTDTKLDRNDMIADRDADRS